MTKNELRDAIARLDLWLAGALTARYEAEARVRGLEEAHRSALAELEDVRARAAKDGDQARRYSELLAVRDRELAGARGETVYLRTQLDIERGGRLRAADRLEAQLRAERDDARHEADRLGDRCEELEGQVAELLPWAARGVTGVGEDHDCRDHVADDCADYRDALELRALIDAGEFGEFREVRP